MNYKPSLLPLSLRTALLLTVSSLCTHGHCNTISIRGTFVLDSDVVLLNFEPNIAADILTVETFSYAGGKQADGTTVPSGGFDTIVSVFDGTGNFLGLNVGSADDRIDPITGRSRDAFLQMAIPQGNNFTVALTQYDNFPLGSLQDGFDFDSSPGNFTGDFGCPNGKFCEFSTESQRNGEWAIDIGASAAGESVWDVLDLDYMDAPGRIELVGFGSVDFMPIPAGGEEYGIEIPVAFAQNAVEGFTVFSQTKSNELALSFPQGNGPGATPFGDLFPGFTPQSALADLNAFFSDPVVRGKLATAIPEMGSELPNPIEIYKFDSDTGIASLYGAGGIESIPMQVPEPSSITLMLFALLALAHKPHVRKAPRIN